VEIQKFSLTLFVKAGRYKNLGIENVVPQTECKEKIGCIRYDNQCKANIPGMH
jgi:hypothetical protein